MKDRMISQNAVVALLDIKEEKLNDLLKQPLCRGVDRKIIASNISLLLTIRQQLNFISSPEELAAGGEFPIEVTAA